MKPFDDREERKSVTYALQLLYYDKALQDKKSTLAAYRNELERGNFKVLLGNLTASSMGYLKHHLHQHVSHQETFDPTHYRDKFVAFVTRYPRSEESRVGKEGVSTISSRW